MYICDHLVHVRSLNHAGQRPGLWPPLVLQSLLHQLEAVDAHLHTSAESIKSPKETARTYSGLCCSQIEIEMTRILNIDGMSWKVG